jgi:hypothetical protein
VITATPWHPKRGSARHNIYGIVRQQLCSRWKHAREYEQKGDDSFRNTDVVSRPRLDEPDHPLYSDGPQCLLLANSKTPTSTDPNALAGGPNYVNGDFSMINVGDGTGTVLSRFLSPGNGPT